MKNKSFIYKGLAVTLLAGLSLGNIACSGSYLDEVENSGAFKSEEYFQNETQSFSALVSVYDVLRKYSGGFENTVTFLMQDLMIFIQEVGTPVMGLVYRGLIIMHLIPIRCLQAIGEIIIRELPGLHF